METVNRGQAALIVLLVVGVALGFALSTISRSTTELKISEQEQEASRAFNAAEAGIEEALRNLAAGSGSVTVDDITVNYTVEELDNLEGVFEENEAAQVSLTGAGLGLSQLTIEWVDSPNTVENPGCDSASAVSGGTAASLLITVIDDTYQVTRTAVNACDLASENGMLNVTDSGSDNYLRRYDLAVDSNDVLVRIRPIYNRASLRVTANADLPVQYYRIDSQAAATNLAVKSIQVTRTVPATAAIFDYVLFSGTNITK
jgi:type II secretory pathway pseudopilin PulG